MRRVGENAFLLDAGSVTAALAVYRRLAAAPPRDLSEIVPGAASVLVVFDRVPLDEECRRLAEIEASAPSGPEQKAPGRLHEIAVRYDGPDLGDLAASTGLEISEVIRRHAAAEYRVAFLGFQPGFAYLSGLPRALVTDRRASPRARIPAGSVAIGGEWTGIYPAESPGGWNLIGTASQTLFDPTLDPPATLAPGHRVRFVVR